MPGGPGRTRPIIQTGNYAANVGQIQLTVDADTNAVLAYTATNVADRRPASCFDPVSSAPRRRSPTITGIVERALANAAQVGGQPVGSVTADITTAFTGGTYGPGGYGGGRRRPRQPGRRNRRWATWSPTPCWTRWRPRSAAARRSALMNPGGLRAELLYGDDGVITYAEANGVLPFVNNLFTTDLTGSQLMAVLEQQWQTAIDADRAAVVRRRPYLQLGLSDEHDLHLRPRSRRRRRHRGRPGRPGQAHPTVGGGRRAGDRRRDLPGRHVVSFLLEGGDNFRAFAGGTDTRDSGLIDRDAWIAYLQANPGLTPDVRQARGGRHRPRRPAGRRRERPP